VYFLNQVGVGLAKHCPSRDFQNAMPDVILDNFKVSWAPRSPTPPFFTAISPHLGDQAVSATKKIGWDKFQAKPLSIFHTPGEGEERDSLGAGMATSDCFSIGFSSGQVGIGDKIKIKLTGLERRPRLAFPPTFFCGRNRLIA
jgi:hypothetical protein